MCMYTCALPQNTSKYLKIPSRTRRSASVEVRCRPGLDAERI